MKQLFLIVAATLISFCACHHAHAGEESRSTYQSGVATNLADNTAGDISAADIRGEFTDLSDSAFFMSTDTLDDITEGTTNKHFTATYKSTVDALDSDALLGSNNLSDLGSSTTALGNLGFTSTITELNYTDGVTSSIQTQINGKASDTQTVDIASGHIETADNKTYTIDIDVAQAGTITETTTDAGSGTCTATFEINGTPLGGTANSVSTTKTSQAHGSANSLAVNDELTLVISSNSSCTDVVFSINGTKTYAN